MDIFEFIKLETSLNSRKSYGGTAPECVKKAINDGKILLNKII